MSIDIKDCVIYVEILEYYFLILKIGPNLNVNFDHIILCEVFL